MTPQTARPLEETTKAASDLVARTRAAQGLPRHVEDPAVLHRVARVLTRPETP